MRYMLEAHLLWLLGGEHILGKCSVVVAAAYYVSGSTNCDLCMQVHVYKHKCTYQSRAGYVYATT